MLSTGVAVVMRGLLLGIALRGGLMFTLGKESDKMLQMSRKWCRGRFRRLGVGMGAGCRSRGLVMSRAIRTTERLVRVQGAIVGSKDLMR